MAQFAYQNYSNPYVNSISQLIARQGEIPAQAALAAGNAQANAAVQSGQAIGGAIQSIGQIPQQMQQLKQQQLQQEAIATRTAIEKQQLASAQRVEQARQQINALANDPSVFNDDGTFNLKGIAGKMSTSLPAGAAGPVQPPDLTTIASIIDPLNEHIAKARDARMTWENAKQNALARIASTAYTLGAPNAQQPNGSYVEHAQVGIAAALKAGLINQDEANKFLLPMIERPEATPQMLQVIASQNTLAPIKVGEKDRLLDPLNPQHVLVSAQPTMNETELALAAAGGDPKKAMQLLKPGPKQSIEEEWLARDLRMAVAANKGQPLSDEQAKAVATKSMQQYAEAKSDPAVRDAALAQKNVALLLAQAQLNQMPTPEQAKSVAEDMVNHRIAPEQLASLFSTRGKEGLAFKLAVTSEAKKLDPQFNFEEASASYNLAKSPAFQNTVRYMDSVLESMPRLLQNAKNLGNGDFRSWNQLANAAKSQFNDTDLKRLRTDAVLVGDEVAKILAGGGTGSTTSDAKLKQGMDIISQTDSVPAMAAALDEIQTLIGYRRKAQTRGTYMEGTGAGAPKPKILKLVNGQLVPE